MTADRITSAQPEIQKILAAKPEYVVNTSEFNDVQGRLMALHSHRKLDKNDDPNGPRLRRPPGNGPIEEGSPDDKQNPDQDERPTLKRRE